MHLADAANYRKSDVPARFPGQCLRDRLNCPHDGIGNELERVEWCSWPRSSTSRGHTFNFRGAEKGSPFFLPISYLVNIPVQFLFIPFSEAEYRIWKPRLTNRRWRITLI